MNKRKYYLKNKTYYFIMVQYECKKCLFLTTHKPNYNRHLLTEKHKRNEIDNSEKNNEIKHNKNYICKTCIQKFSSRQSLHRHVNSRCKVMKEKEYILKVNKIKSKISGWIYCITNPLYKMDDTYKLGYTANKECFESVKKCLIQRYSTYYPNVECIELFEVKTPIQAEKQLFTLLKDYKYSNELIKADYKLVIKPYLTLIQSIYSFN